MAWADNLLDASFRGFKFDVLKTDDNAERALSEHAYPYRDGADVEDLGRNARRVTIEAIFWDGLIRGETNKSDSRLETGYENRLQEFIKVLDMPGAGEFIHPVFGSIKTAQVVRYTIRHDADNVDQCAVTVEFVESTPGNPFFDRALAAQRAEAIGAKGDVARGKLATGLSNLISMLRANNPLALFNDLREALTLPILSMLNEVQDVLRSSVDLLAAPRAFCNDISAIVDGVLNLMDFGTSLMTTFSRMGSVFGLFDIFGFGSQSGTASSDVIFPAGVPSEAQAISAVEAHISAQTAIGVAMGAGLVFESESEIPTLSPPEIETVANTARDALEAAIVAIRATYPLETARPMVEALKDLALSVQTSAQAIIESRPPLLDRPAPVTGNLRLQAHAWYGDHTRAPELYRLNPTLRLPNFIVQGDVLHAFAS